MRFLRVYLEDATCLIVIDRVRGRRYRVYCGFCSKFLEGTWTYKRAVECARRHLKSHGVSESLLVEVVSVTPKGEWVVCARLFSIPVRLAQKIAWLEGASSGHELTIKRLIEENAELFKSCLSGSSR
jgi:hypothetical protein